MKTKKSLRDTIAESQKGMDAWATAFGKPKHDLGVPEKRTHTKQMLDSDREDAVLREVGELLSKHPAVLFAVRQNSGMAYNESRAPVYFYRWVKSVKKMRISDFWGMLKSGVMFALEGKNRTWKKPSGERELEQKEFLDAVASAGGVSGFVTSAEQAMAIIESSTKER